MTIYFPLKNELILCTYILDLNILNTNNNLYNYRLNNFNKFTNKY